MIRPTFTSRAVNSSVALSFGQWERWYKESLMGFDVQVDVLQRRK